MTFFKRIFTRPLCVVPHSQVTSLLLIAHGLDGGCVCQSFGLQCLQLVEDGEAAWAGTDDAHSLLRHGLMIYRTTQTGHRKRKMGFMSLSTKPLNKPFKLS